MTELPPEVLRFLGSRFQGVTPLITYLYSCPTCAVGMSADQTPLVPSATSELLLEDHPLNWPATRTLDAFGAHTRKVTPPAYGVEPQPGRADCACAGDGRPRIASKTRHAIDVRWDVALRQFINLRTGRCEDVGVRWQALRKDSKRGG